MKNSLKIIVAVLAVTLIAFSTQVYADPSGAAVTTISEETYTAAVGTEDVEGGNISSVNITGNQVTTRWAGFFGNISGGIILANAAGTSFYEWTISNVADAIVYAANESIASWATLGNATKTDMYGFLSLKATDNYTETFGSKGSDDFNGNTISGYYTSTWNNTEQGTLKTYSLKADTTTLVWAGVAQNNVEGFDGSQVDYQILVPASATALTYNFYLELP